MSMLCLVDSVPCPSLPHPNRVIPYVLVSTYNNKNTSCRASVHGSTFGRGSPRVGPTQKSKSSFPCAYPLGPKVAWLLIRLPLLKRVLVELERCFLSPSPAAPCALTLGAAHLRGSHLHRSAWLLFRPLPSQHALIRLPCRALRPSPAVLRALACCTAYLRGSHLCVARSLVVRPSPIVVGHTADPAMLAGAHVPWCLRPSPIEPKAPTSVAGVNGARATWLAAGSHPDGRNRLAQPPIPYVAYICFKCFRRFICVLQLFHLDVQT
jgi:hypothetical protein